jgi:hypothetical protein
MSKPLTDAMESPVNMIPSVKAVFVIFILNTLHTHVSKEYKVKRKAIATVLRNIFAHNILKNTQRLIIDARM